MTTVIVRLVLAAVLHEVVLRVLDVSWAGEGAVRGGGAFHHSSGATGVEVGQVLRFEWLLLVLVGVSLLVWCVLLGGVRVRLTLETVDVGLAGGPAP